PSPIEPPGGKARQLANGRRLLSRDDLKSPAVGLWRSGELEYRVRHVVHGHDVEDAVVPARHHLECSGGRRPYWAVHHVERGRPPGVTLPDDDARSHDRQGQPLALGLEQKLSLLFG